MAKLSLKTGTTSKILEIFIQDSSVSTGAGLTGLAYNTANLVASYVRPGAARQAITLATQTTTGAFSSGGFVEVDATNMPGVYRFDVPDAALASGASSVLVMLKGATNMAPCLLEIELTAVDNQSTTAFITGINSVAPPTNWNLTSVDSNGRVDVIKIAGTTQTARDIGASVLLSSGTGTGQISLSSGGVLLSAAGSAALTEGYATDGSAATLAQLLYQIWAMLAESSVSSTTLTAKKLDGSTSAMTFTLDDATNPTSITRAS